MISWMQTHRKYLVPTIWISTIAFVGAGFVGWGAYDYGNNKSDTVAQVGEKTITVNELQSNYSNLFAYYNQLFAGKLTQEKAEQLRLQDIAMENLVNEALLLNYANELGLVALDQEVINEYTSMPAFQVDGVYNKERHKELLKARGMQAKAFEHEVRKSIVLRKLREGLYIPLTDLEKEAAFSAISLADHLVVKKISEDVDAIQVDEATARESWENSKNDYMSNISYLLETIKVPTAGIEVNADEVEAFYNEKKFKFKDADGKILPLDEARDAVVKALQLKRAKKSILKEYLALKKGEKQADEEMLVDATTEKFPFESLKEIKEGGYVKAIELADGYLTARVKKINQPAPLPFEEAKPMVIAKVQQQKALALLEERAKKESEMLENGEDIGFVSINDAEKLSNLTVQEASQFLQYLFSKSEKSGYFITGNSAIVYQVKEQKLFDQNAYNAAHETNQQNIANTKETTIESGLIQELKKKYKIEKFIKEG